MTQRTSAAMRRHQSSTMRVGTLATRLDGPRHQRSAVQVTTGSATTTAIALCRCLICTAWAPAQLAASSFAQ
jgi:hypothetical protein